MKNKTKAGQKNTSKTTKPGSTSVRQVAPGKKNDLSKTRKSQVEQPKPDKPKVVKSLSASAPTKLSQVRVSAKPKAVVKAQVESPKPDKPKVVKSPSSPSTATPSVLDFQEQRARIARRAYELYEERCPPDADVQDWLRAERELMGKP